MSTLTKSRFDLGILPAFASSAIAKPGHRLVDLKGLGILPGIGGGDGTGGYNAAGDILTQTVDGFDLNDLWGEYQQAMALQNEQRSRLVQFLTFPVTSPQERVPQFSQGDFEVASEFGEPRGIRPKVAQFTLGYDFEWYDLAARFTWKFLAEAPRQQIDAINAMAIEADSRLVFRKVMQALFVNVNREADINGVQDVDVYALYNADGTVPPSYGDNVFNGSHSHYMTSGGTALTSEDFDDLYENVAEHGYKWENGYTVVALMNSREVKEARKWRVSLGDTWDFIPAQGQPGALIQDDVRLIGASQAASTFQGLPVVGTYGNITIIEHDLIPAGYVPIVATGGQESLNNPVGIREHVNTSLRGLRLVKGPQANYPLIDSFYNRGFGTGIRQRGGAAIMQVTASATYTPPTQFALV